MQLNDRTRWHLRIQNIVFVALVLALLGGVAWLGERYSHEFDWTANQRNSLSEDSVALLEALAGPVHITAYASEDEMLREGIRVLVRRYQRVKPDVQLEFVNPDLAPERTRAAGIRFDGTLVIEYQGRREQLDSISESDISAALARLSRDSEAWIVFMSGHGERAYDGQANFDLGTLGAELEKQGLKQQALNLAANALPDNTAVLVIAGPQTEWLPAETARVREYLDAGGNLLWLTDPAGVASLPELQAMCGITVEPGTVVDATTQLLGVNDPSIALVTEYPAVGPAAGFQLLTLYPRAAGLSIRPDSEWQATPILRTLRNSWRETGALEGNVTLDEGDAPGPVTIGYALERIVESTAAGDQDETVDDAGQDEPQEAGRTQRVIVVGDGDFASNAFVANQGNLDFAANLFNWLAVQDVLLNIRIRPAPDVNLALSRTQQLMIAAGFLLVLPLTLLAGGVAVFLRRRRR